jgi:hypothetical protein
MNCKRVAADNNSGVGDLRNPEDTVKRDAGIDVMDL